MKKYQVKIYNSTGATFKEVIDPDSIKNEIEFSSSINGGQGACTISLNVPFDNYSANIAHMNIVKIYQFDDDANIAGRLIYTGFISEIVPHWDDSDEGVTITLLGLVSFLSLAYYKDADYSVTHTGVDPEAILEAIITHFNTVYSGSIISYTSASIANVGTNVTYTFSQKKWIEAIEIAANLGGASYYWFIDETGLFTFAPKPTTSTHTFTIGKDVDLFESLSTNELIKNKITVEYTGGSTVTVDDATSQSAYGIREDYISDSSLGNSASATQRGNQELAQNKDLKFNVSMRINSSYDIESIRPGDTCKIRNWKTGAGIFQDNMKIVNVAYSPDYATIELEEFSRDFGKVLKKFIS